MKIIDLLNKIAKGEEVPKKIKFCLRNFEFSKYKQDYFCRDNDEQGIYGMSICKWLFLPLLNDEVEIIEEDKKIEKIVEYLKHHIPIIIQDNDGWCNADIYLENGTLIVKPNYNFIFGGK